MAKKVILGEAHDLLRLLPLELLKLFDSIRKDDKRWEPLQKYVRLRKDMKMDRIYRLKRPQNQDEIIRNAIDHEYHAATITELAVFLQLCENASDEMERRERKEK